MIPTVLTDRPQWIVWRYEHREGKPSKVPYQTDGHRASSVDPTHWVTYDQARSAFEQSSGGFDGIGFVFTDSDPFIGIDLDGCREDGELIGWAQEIVDRVPGYCEISPSDKGVKIFAMTSAKPDRGRKHTISNSTAIEVYPAGRYFTVTGRAIAAPAELVDADEGVRWLYEKYFPAPKTPPAPVRLPPGTNALSRAIAYADKYPPAISGQDGHGVTFRLACVLANGFALNEDETFSVLQRWNATCSPPWSDKEIAHKIRSAIATGDREGNRGYMLDTGWIEPVDQTEYEVYLGDLLADLEKKLNGVFPPDLYHVPGLVADVARWIDTQNPRPNKILSLMAALALQGILVARKVKDKTGARSNLFMVAIAPSGGGKQAPQTCIQRLLGLTGQSQLYGGKVSSDSAIAQDLVANPAKLYIFDEFGKFLRKTRESLGGVHMHAIQEVLLELWGSTSNPLWKHKSMAEAKFNREVVCPFVSFLGFTVPGNFWQGLEEEHLTDGFAARLIVVDSGPRVASVTPTESDPPPAILEQLAYWRDFAPGGNLAAAGRFDPLVIETTPEAEQAFDALVALQEAKEGEVAEVIWSRAIEKARRLAIVYACSRDHEAPRVDADAANWAVRFITWTTETFLQKAAEEVSGDEAFQRKYQRVLRLIKQKSSKRHVCDRSTLIKSMKCRAKDLDEVLLSLKQADLIEERLVGSGRSGRVAYHLR